MAAKHMPGPWEANVETNGDVFAGDFQIADCDWPQGELSQETIEANARLVAAAPELLAASQFTLDWLESFNIPPQTTPDERDEVRRVLRAAIAKASEA